MMRFIGLTSSAQLLFAIPVASAADVAASTTTSGTGWQVLTGLATVLGIIAAAAWLLRRFAPGAICRQGPMQILSILPVGTRERVVLIQCRNTWIVVGMSPGRLTALHTMSALHGPDEEIPATDTAVRAAGNQSPLERPPRPPSGFAGWLEKALSNHGR